MGRRYVTLFIAEAGLDFQCRHLGKGVVAWVVCGVCGCSWKVDGFLRVLRFSPPPRPKRYLSVCAPSRMPQVRLYFLRNRSKINVYGFEIRTENSYFRFTLLTVLSYGLCKYEGCSKRIASICRWNLKQTNTYPYSAINSYTMMCPCAHKSNWKIDYFPFEHSQSLTTVVKMVGKSVAKKEEIRAYMETRSKIGCSLKQIFAEISAVYGSTNVSYDTVRRWKKIFDSGLDSIENAPKSGRPKSESCGENGSKLKEIDERDARYTLDDKARMVGISLSRVHYILKNILNVRKISVRWVPYLLSDGQRSKEL